MGIERIKPKLHMDVLSSDDIAAIQSATLEILEKTGVHCPSEKARQLYADHGAVVNQETMTVRFPPDMVLKAMSQAPRSYELAGRTEGTTLILDGSSSHFGTDGTGVNTVDFASGKRRSSTKEDVAMMAHVSDALGSIAFYWPMVSAQDYGLTASLHEIEASFKNTTKHVQTVTATNPLLARYAIQMAEVMAGDRQKMRTSPPLSALICTIAPLGQDIEGIEAAMIFSEAGIPVGFMSMPTMGSTAPATVGGALTVGNAELVSVITLMQLIQPGAPVFYSLCGSVIDPQTAEYMVGMPEKYLSNTAGIQLAHDWGVPALAGTYAMDSPEPATWQLGRDSVYTALMSGLAGADLAEGLGMLESSTLLVPEQIIFDDEIFHIHRNLYEGVDTTIDQLAVDVIAKVGPGGHFLGEKHTRKHLREIWIPDLTHPRISPGDPPSPDIRQRARAKLDRILNEHEPEPLEQAVQDELRTILDAAEQELEGVS